MIIFSFNLACHILQITGDLGDQHRIGTHCNASLQRQPSGLLSQDLHHCNFAGRLGRLTSPVQHFDGEAQRAVEPEGDHGGGNVVLDRPGDAHRIEPFAMELIENAQPPATDD